jgi:hypothetical protein
MQEEEPPSNPIAFIAPYFINKIFWIQACSQEFETAGVHGGVN